MRSLPGRRLFVAIEIPDAARDALAALQPDASTGVRLVPPHLFHATVHFRGVAGVDATIASLVAVSSPRFALALHGAGQFPGRDGEVALWAGVAPNDRLTALHGAVGAALTVDGWTPDARPYAPHVTLARCKRTVPRDLVDAFLARGAGFAVAPFAVETFALYVSTPGPSGPIYTVERRFPLTS